MSEMQMLRELFAAARRAGWDHVVYGGAYGTEHVWRRGCIRVCAEPVFDRRGRNWRLIVADDDGVETLSALVHRVHQVLGLLEAYGLTPGRELVRDAAAVTA